MSIFCWELQIYAHKSAPGWQRHFGHCMCTYGYISYDTITWPFTYSNFHFRIYSSTQQVRQWELTCIHTCRPTSTRCAIFHERRICSVTFVVCHPSTSRWLVHSSDFGLLGEKSSTKWKIPWPVSPWTTVQNLTPLALSSPEKSVTVQTNKKNQTNKQ